MLRNRFFLAACVTAVAAIGASATVDRMSLADAPEAGSEAPPAESAVASTLPAPGSGGAPAVAEPEAGDDFDTAAASARTECCIAGHCIGVVTFADCFDAADAAYPPSAARAAGSDPSLATRAPAGAAEAALTSELLRVLDCEDVQVPKWVDGQRYASGIYGRCRVAQAPSCSESGNDVVLWRRIPTSDGRGMPQLRQPENGRTFAVVLGERTLWDLPLVDYAFDAEDPCAG